MEWADETGRHVGYPAAVLPDGGEPPPLPDGRRTWWLYNGADGPRAVGVRGACGCGWRGGQTHPIDFGDDEKTAGWESRTGPFADWEYHVAQAEGVVPYDVEQMLTALRRRIEELAEQRPVTALHAAARVERLAPELARHAARSARRGLVSWETIGRALGTSRQAAHERFARHVDDH